MLPFTKLRIVTCYDLSPSPQKQQFDALSQTVYRSANLSLNRTLGAVRKTNYLGDVRLKECFRRCLENQFGKTFRESENHTTDWKTIQRVESFDHIFFTELVKNNELDYH